MPEFQCAVCKLKYAGKTLADQCFAWCSTHDSCNFLIAKQAINKDEMKRGEVKDERFRLAAR